MVEEIFADVVTCFIFIFIIYSIIKLGINNEKLEEENEELKECIKKNLETFKDITEYDRKIHDEILDTEKELIQLTKMLGGQYAVHR